MFGISLPEALVILAAALIVVGPEKLPKVAISVARFLRQCRTFIDDIRHASLHQISEPKTPRPKELPSIQDPIIHQGSNTKPEAKSQEPLVTAKPVESDPPRPPVPLGNP
jgi:Sec-independent protein translocase protein TatA